MIQDCFISFDEFIVSVRKSKTVNQYYHVQLKHHGHLILHLCLNFKKFEELITKLLENNDKTITYNIVSVKVEF